MTTTGSTGSTGFRVEIADGIAVVTVDRPKANAIDAATSFAMGEAFVGFESDPAVRVAIVTGAGERFFSAGWDLNAANEGEAINADHGPGGFAGLTEYFQRSKPVIAAVNGLAMGGGFELALAADMIVASQDAQFALTEVKLGMIADSGGVLRLPRRLPRAIAAELMMTGRRMGAQEALAWGLVNRVVASDQLLDSAHAYELHLPEPPPVDAFWSLTMYGEDQFFVENPLQRFALGDRDALKFNPDGSLDLYVQATSPGADKESNWLPAPNGAFTMNMRLYLPRPEAIDGRWSPPVIQLLGK